MEKRAILAVALSVLILFAFRYFEQQRELRNPRPAPLPGTQAEKPVTAPAQAAPQPLPVQTAATGETSAGSQRVVMEGDLYRAVVDNRGAVLASFELKGYKSVQGNVFELIPSSREGDSWSMPGSLLFEDPGLTALANGQFYEVHVEGSAPPATVTLTLHRQGLSVTKTYRFAKDNYLVELTGNFAKDGQKLDGRFLLGQDIGPEQEHLLSPARLDVAYYSGGKVRRENPPKNESEVKRIDGDTRWVGLDMQYFALLAVAAQPLPYFEMQKRAVKAVGLDGKEVDRDLIRVTLPVSGTLQYQIYLGPKRQADLEKVRAADITGVINYGWFSFLVLLLLPALRWIHQFVNNYGVAIIVLTFLLSLLLFPFRLKQMLSMKKMQVVQPKVKAIQEKYRRYKKTDPKRAEMNQEIMALYKEHNVNPLGGCFPLLLQFPLLFAFYALLAYSIELRQAPFIGWIHDLSAKDPYYVLPIVMGITMFISQKMTPMAPGTDPAQAKMMMIMPVVFTLMFFNYSSGLNLYFLCSNIFQVGFQKIAERYLGDGKPGDKPKS